MTNVPSKFKIPVATKQRSKFDLTSHVVMTHDFGVLNPIMCKAMFPGDSFKVNPEFFTYLDPLPAPTFGDVRMVTRGFFVPFRIIYEDWKEFISNQKIPTDSDTLKTPYMPFTSVSEFTWSLFGNPTDANRLINFNGEREDIKVYRIARNADNIPFYQDFTFELSYLGRQYLSILRGLGYNFPFVFCLEDDISLAEVQATEDNDLLVLYKYAIQKLSLLPWVSFWRFYIDWIVPSRFISHHIKVLNGLKMFKNPRKADIQYFSNTFFGESLSSKYYATSNFLTLFIDLPSIYLDDDFFTNAFTSPYGYEDSANVGFSTSLQNVQNTSFKFDSAGVDVAGKAGANLRTSDPNDNNSQFAINMFSLRSLGALQDMVNRGKVAGSKIQDYLKVTYGIEPEMSALDISTYLGFHYDKVKIGSVSSNADTFVETTGDGAYLGQYAGRGLAGNQNIGTYEYTAKEHGLFFVTCELVAKSSYWQGLRPECQMLDRLDFFQPEFDSLGVEAIPLSMLNNGVDLNLNEVYNLGSPNDVFGFTPTYSKYKVSFDSLLGDFRVPGLNTGLDSWYLARYFTEPEYISENFSRMVQDNTSKEYDHIFQLADNSADHFKTYWTLHCKAERNMIPYKDSLEFEDKKGKEVESSFNGSVNS